jgi:purine-binding chemotaxis protein CheW
MSFHFEDYSYGRRSTSADADSRHFKIRLRGQTIGIPVERVKTVFHVDTVTTVPLAPPEVAGLANLRGRVVTLLHLDRCLRLDETIDDRLERLAVGVEHNGEEYALLIDETDDVIAIGEEDRIDCPAHVDPGLRELLAGCYRVESEFLTILDVGALLRRVTQSSEQTLRKSRRGVSGKGAGI